ncbi:MAG: VCBS repeat-containing protein, partial [Planctomycetota bacterium]|nr:VCBS repeat-containing protein [Planctomycetota bacterium]
MDFIARFGSRKKGIILESTGAGVALLDYDLDGDLDLCVVSYWGEHQGNRLFRNNGDETFTDVTDVALGMGVFEVWGFQPAFVDMNGDRYPELLISADYETSRYLVNNADGTFTDMTVASGTGLDDNGMGQAVGDFDNDGLLDWYVSSIHQLIPPPGHNSGNMLYVAQGSHCYVESSVATGTNDGGWGWGTVTVDLDNDTWLDIVEVKGRPAKGGEWINEPGKLFHNDGDGTFTEMAAATGFD